MSIDTHKIHINKPKHQARNKSFIVYEDFIKTNINKQKVPMST